MYMLCVHISLSLSLSLYIYNVLLFYLGYRPLVSVLGPFRLPLEVGLGGEPDLWEDRASEEAASDTVPNIAKTVSFMIIMIFVTVVFSTVGGSSTHYLRPWTL